MTFRHFRLILDETLVKIKSLNLFFLNIEKYKRKFKTLR